MHDTGAHWRDSSLTPKFFMIDARVCIPLLLVLMHVRVWTIVLSLIVFVFFALLGRWGVSLPVFLRLVRTTIAGNEKVRIKRR